MLTVVNPLVFVLGAAHVFSRDSSNLFPCGAELQSMLNDSANGVCPRCTRMGHCWGSCSNPTRCIYEVVRAYLSANPQDDPRVATYFEKHEPAASPELLQTHSSTVEPASWSDTDSVIRDQQGALQSIWVIFNGKHHLRRKSFFKPPSPTWR